jgi:hypothetical protein
MYVQFSIFSVCLSPSTDQYIYDKPIVERVNAKLRQLHILLHGNVALTMFWNRLVEDYFKIALWMIWIVMVTFGASIQGLSLHFMMYLLPPTPSPIQYYLEVVFFKTLLEPWIEKFEE